MDVHSADAWKLALGVVLGGAILLSLLARAPRYCIPGNQLHRLVLAALTLYSVGAFAWLTHHRLLAAAVCAGGTVVATLAAWLSRGSSPDDPLTPPDDPPGPGPPDEPEGRPQFDWAAFEQGFRAYARRQSSREPARRG